MPLTDSSTPDSPEVKAVELEVRRPSGEAPRVVHVPMRTAVNYWLDIALAVTFLVLIWMASVTRFVFPLGAAAFEYRLWGWSVEDWRAAEFAILCGFAVFVVVHVTLHWNWVCSISNSLIRRRSPGSDDGGRTLLGVALLIVILHLVAAGLLWAKFSLRSVHGRSQMTPSTSTVIAALTPSSSSSGYGHCRHFFSSFSSDPIDACVRNSSTQFSRPEGRRGADVFRPTKKKRAVCDTAFWQAGGEVESSNAG